MVGARSETLISCLVNAVFAFAAKTPCTVSQIAAFLATIQLA